MPVDDDTEHVVEIMRPKKKRPRRSATLLVLADALRSWPEFASGRMFRKDTFSGEVIIAKALNRPSVEPHSAWNPLTEATDIHVTWLMEALEAGNIAKLTRGMVNAALEAEADRNQFSSAGERLAALSEWDGVPRLERFWIEVCGAPTDELGMSEDEIWGRTRYLQATARAFFIGIVARVMQPGCKLDTMPVLEGEQGKLKSTLLRVIAFDDEKWFSDSLPADLKNKDARAHLAGKMVVEFAELSQMKSTRQLEMLKAFISAQDDKFRPAYGHREVVHRRQCVFVGTTNGNRYLTDITGNRRFWPVRCLAIDIGKARAWMPQLYAEALAAYSQGEQWWLPSDIEIYAHEEQEARLEEDPWTDLARDLVGLKKDAAIGRGEAHFFIRSDQLLAATPVPPERLDLVHHRRACDLLRKFGGENKKLPRGDGWPKRAFCFETWPPNPD